MTDTRLYETPWLIVFDTIHAQYREAEIVDFRREMEKAGRPVCLLVVTGPQVGPALANKRFSVQLAELNHIISVEDARALGDGRGRLPADVGRDQIQRPQLVVLSPPAPVRERVEPGDDFLFGRRSRHGQILADRR